MDLSIFIKLIHLSHSLSGIVKYKGQFFKEIMKFFTILHRDWEKISKSFEEKSFFFHAPKGKKIGLLRIHNDIIALIPMKFVKYITLF